MTLRRQSLFTVTKYWHMQTGKLARLGFGVMGLSTYLSIRRASCLAGLTTDHHDSVDCADSLLIQTR
jgi:hypothetical protein